MIACGAKLATDVGVGYGDGGGGWWVGGGGD